ncbi:hypothetical protein [Geitlerinema sp. PCC 9228]|jgi:hypothetical protein|uniref:hypothetical protein n=1 Tax=Geitlerinema sp. PCC 9228 TaxID=111611 RepID=UPI0008F9B7E0|nr:hypothetical protein [Geitlerinema sp. PCC 9228]
MTGFIRGLFGSKKSNNGDRAPKKRTNRSSGTYYLDPDDAKTMGNMDYMRTPRKIRKTFAKKADQADANNERVEYISSMGRSTGETAMPESSEESTETNNTNNNSTSSFQPQPQFNNNDVSQRRSSDSNMDMFRNMARDIKKSR